MTDAHLNILTTDEKFEILRKMTNVVLENTHMENNLFQIYIQDRDTPGIRYWARMGYDRDELVNDMYDHYYQLMWDKCHGKF